MVKIGFEAEDVCGNNCSKIGGVPGRRKYRKKIIMDLSGQTTNIKTKNGQMRSYNKGTLDFREDRTRNGIGFLNRESSTNYV